MNYKKYLPDLFLLFLPALICLIVFYSPSEIKEMLTMSTEDYSILSIYTTNFVHYEWGHLTRNLAYYLAFGLTSLLLLDYLGYRKIFRYSLPIILIVVPILSSIYSVWVITNCGGRVNIFGFSAVAGAVMGLFGYGGALLISFDEKDYPYSYLLLMLFTMYYFVSTYLGLLNVFSIAMLLSAMLPFYVIANRHAKDQNRRKRIFAGLVYIFAYLFFLETLFPLNLVSNGNLVNILGHLLGVSFGICIPYFLVTLSGMGLRTE